MERGCKRVSVERKGEGKSRFVFSLFRWMRMRVKTLRNREQRGLQKDI
jgi:hypothetical protein